MNEPAKKSDRKQALLDSGVMVQVVRQLFPDARATSGEQVIVRCPFHDDKSPSLSINTTTGLYNCFACAAKGDGFALYMKVRSCDFKTAMNDIEAMAGIQKEPTTKKQRPQVVAKFIYHDEFGKPRYWKKRFEPGFDDRKKSFAFYHTAGGTEAKGRGGNSLLYNLHLLKAVTGPGPVFFVEGEAKADALTAWGLCATSLDSGGQCGKGATWQKEFTGYFAGKEVYIMPDNDQTGEEYAASVAGRLLGVAATVKVLRLPDLPLKGDIIDWIRQHEQGATL